MILDVTDSQALQTVCNEAQLIINCVGPYLKHGADIATATLAANASYIDFANEQSHYNRLQRLDKTEVKIKIVALPEEIKKIKSATLYMNSPIFENATMKIKEEKRELEKLEKIGWGLFLVMLGAIWLFPDSIVPEGTFMFGVGIILLGLNLVKYTKGYQVNGFTVFLGIIALIAGLFSLLGRPVDIFPLILILWGVSIIFGIVRKKRKKSM